MASQLRELVHCWMAWGGIERESGAEPRGPGGRVRRSGRALPAGRRAPRDRGLGAPARLRLPCGLRAWLMLSNGLYLEGPLDPPDHRRSVRWSSSRGSTTCWCSRKAGSSWATRTSRRSASTWRTAGRAGAIRSSPRATSSRAPSPRIIARSFEEWFLELLRTEAGSTGSIPISSIWATPGRPTAATRPSPSFPTGFARSPTGAAAHAVASEEREIAAVLGLTHGDVELLFRHLQHVAPDLTPS